MKIQFYRQATDRYNLCARYHLQNVIRGLSHSRQYTRREIDLLSQDREKSEAPRYLPQVFSRVGLWKKATSHWVYPIRREIPCRVPLSSPRAGRKRRGEGEGLNKTRASPRCRHLGFFCDPLDYCKNAGHALAYLVSDLPIEFPWDRASEAKRNYNGRW